VREEFVRTVATAIGLFASTEISLQRVLLSPVSQHYTFRWLLFILLFSKFISPKILRLVCRSCN
jgi:hypothetical protein